MFTPMSAYPDANDCANFAKRDMVATNTASVFSTVPGGARRQGIGHDSPDICPGLIGTLIFRPAAEAHPAESPVVWRFQASGARSRQDGAVGKASTRSGAVAQQNFVNAAFGA
jgi:hypothetical protein